MNEEKTNIIPYNSSSGTQQPPRDYSNSNRSKMAGAQQQNPALPSTGYSARTEIAASGDGFFKATLKQAVDHAIKTVIDPMIRNFVYSTGMSILNTLLWNGGKGSPAVPTVGTNTPYNLISTPVAVERKPQLTKQDRVWQRYEKLHVNTLDEANAIMSRLFKEFLKNGQVTLAKYYECFGEPYEFPNETWGWTSLPKDKMYAQQFADGYHVIMPKLEGLV